MPLDPSFIVNGLLLGSIYALAALTVTNGAQAQSPAGNTVPVTIENYNRAQTDVYFAGVVKSGGFGNFRHGRELAPPVQQGIVRPNRDTLYSFAVVDLDAGAVKITLPDAGKRFSECRWSTKINTPGLPITVRGLIA